MIYFVLYYFFKQMIYWYKMNTKSVYSLEKALHEMKQNIGNFLWNVVRLIKIINWIVYRIDHRVINLIILHLHKSLDSRK